MHQACFRHDMAEKLLNWRSTTLTHLMHCFFSDDAQIFLLIQEI